MEQTIEIKDLVILNEMIKNEKTKNTIIFDDTNDQSETLLEKGYEIERIVNVTTMDNLDLMICYLVQYKDGQLELVPNKTIHKYCPQLAIEFLESRLIFIKDDKSKKFTLNNEDNKSSDTKYLIDAKQRDDSDDVYVFGELSQYLNVDDIQSMIQFQKRNKLIDFSSQIQKLNDDNDQDCQDISNIACPPNTADIYENTKSKHLYNEKLNQQNNDIFVAEKNVTIISDLEEINYTLSLSQPSKVNKDSQELSSISPDILDKLIENSKSSLQVKNKITIGKNSEDKSENLSKLN